MVLFLCFSDQFCWRRTHILDRWKHISDFRGVGLICSPGKISRRQMALSPAFERLLLLKQNHFKNKYTLISFSEFLKGPNPISTIVKCCLHCSFIRQGKSGSIGAVWEESGGIRLPRKSQKHCTKYQCPSSIYMNNTERQIRRQFLDT